MKFLYKPLLLFLMVLFATSINAEDTPGSPANQILVTFGNETINRVPIADSTSGYRARGQDYQNTTWSKNLAGQFAEEYGLQQVAQWPISTLGIHCVIYEITSGKSVDDVLKQLTQDKRVDSAQTMKTFHVLSETYNDPYAKLQTDLSAMHIALAHQVSTGKKVKIAVIDTGIDENHTDLKGQISHAENFVASAPTTATDIHGTAVAGIIAALANNGKGIVGVAPGASLVSLKACWQKGNKSDAICDTFTLAQALNTAINLQPQIINLSLAGPQDPLLERLIDKALDNGIIVVASKSSTTSTEDFPGSMKRVIAVKTQDNTDQPINAEGQDVTAPGKEILTTMPQDTYNFMSGSSFAAAHISGLIALMLETNPALTTPEIVKSLQKASQNQTAKTIDACLVVTCNNVNAVAVAGKSPQLTTAVRLLR